MNFCGQCMYWCREACNRAIRNPIQRSNAAPACAQFIAKAGIKTAGFKIVKSKGRD